MSANFYSSNQPTVNVWGTDEIGNAILVKSTVANIPSGVAGYAVGCELTASDTGNHYLNTGTVSSATFTLIDTASGSLVLPTAATDATTTTTTSLALTQNTVTTGSGFTQSLNGLTTGKGYSITHTTSVIANGGSLLNISSTGIDTSTTTGILQNLSSTASLAGTQVLWTFSGLTTGIGLSMVNAAQTTGAALSITTASATTGGGILVTTPSSNAIVLGRQGATNPAFQVDASAATSVTGVKITSAASGAGVAVAAISSATDEALSVDAKGAGVIKVGSSSTGIVSIGRGANKAPVLSLLKTDVNAQNAAPTAAQWIGGYITHNSQTAGGTLTTPTGALLSGAITGVTVGDSFVVFYQNRGNQTVTLTAGDGNVTLKGTVAIPTLKTTTILFVNTGASTWDAVQVLSA